MSMTIEEAIERMNTKQATRKDIAQEMGFSANTLTRRIKDSGYVFDQKTKKYELTSPKPEKQEINKQENKQYGKQETQKVNKQENKQYGKQSIQKKEKIIKKVTYEIDEDLHFELRMKAFREKRKVSELVEQAIGEYLKK